MEINQLHDLCLSNNLSLTSEQWSLLNNYSGLLVNWNAKINLISRKDEANILERHILHSLTIAMPVVCEYDFAGKRVIDIGTGGGLPGIPLKIAVPSMEISLLDSIQKKITVVSDMIGQLKLTGIYAIASRAEELAKQKEHAHVYDAVISRAVAPLEDLIRWTRDLRKPGAVLFSLKGGDLTEEINRATRMKEVKGIDVKPLALMGYGEFVKEEKKLVRVEL